MNIVKYMSPLILLISVTFTSAFSLRGIFHRSENIPVHEVSDINEFTEDLTMEVEMEDEELEAESLEYEVELEEDEEDVKEFEPQFQ